MLRKIMLAGVAAGLMSVPAMAETAPDARTTSGSPAPASQPATPRVMSDEQMDAVVGGAILVQTRSGRTVWTVTDLAAAEGFNPGGKGNTANAAPGLLKAVGAGGLTLFIE